MSNQSPTNKKYRNWQTAALHLVLLTGNIVFIWLFVSIRCQNMRLETDHAIALTEGWVAEYGGEQIPVSLPAQLKVAPNDTVSYSKILKSQDQFCNCIMFYSCHQTTEVYLDRELLHTYGQNQSTPFPMAVGAGWQCVRLPENWEGKKLEIRQSCSYKDYSGILSVVYIGTKSALVFRTVRAFIETLLWCLPTAIAGISLLCAAFIFHEKNTRVRLRALGIAALITAAWNFLESQVSQLFVERNLVVMNLIFLLFGLIPVFFSRFLLTYRAIRKRKLMHLAFWYSIFTYLLIIFLQISGIRDFLTTIPLVHIAIVLVILGVLDAFLHRSRTKDSEETAVFIASAVFAFLGLLDVLRYYVMPFFTSPVRLARVGLICFFVVLSVSAIRNASRKHQADVEENVLRKLAYTDILTGLPNRTAFEEQKLYYTQKEPDAPLFLTVLDLNELKTINDHYGHEEGDQAIIHIARDLIHAFPEKNTCFRIGGDEFCILSPDDEVLFLQKLQKFRDNMQKTAEQLPYHYSAAYGYTLTKASLIDEAFHTADHNMYLRKTEMKATPENF